VFEGVVEEVSDTGGVAVGEPEQPPGEVGRIVVGSEHTPELSVEQRLGCLS